MALSLIATKLHIPLPPRQPVSRPRLLARLGDGLARPLTVISAPAGFGKTTLLVEWCNTDEGHKYPLAWISLDEDDNDLVRFLTYFGAALATLKPEMGDAILPLLQSPQLPPTKAILTVLINELSSFHSPFALVLDDYHLITAQPVHEAIRFCLDHLPAQMHLVVLTRADPPLPLARLRARDQLIEIRAEDLRFTSDEAAAFLNEVMGLHLEVEEISALESRTEGWIAGLQLAALSMRGGQDPASFVAAFAGSHRYIMDYLVDEVLTRQPETLRSFLLQTSLLEQLNAGLCDAVTGRTDSQTMLDALEHANVFLIPLDDKRCWFRYHHLFADVLRSRLGQTGGGQIRELHMRASAWYEQHEFVSYALKHALEAQNREQAARLVEQNALPMLMHGEMATVLSWIQTLGPLGREHPWLAIYQAWALTLTAQPDQVEAWLGEAQARIPSQASEAERRDLLGHIAAIRAYGAAQRGEASRAVELGDEALELLPKSDQAIRSVVMMTLGTVRRLSGDLAGASRVLVEARRAGQAGGNLYLAIGALSGLADLYFDQGKLHQSADAYRELLDLATQPDGRRLPASGMACFGLGLNYYEWNDLTAALDHALQSIELCRRWAHSAMLAASYGLLSRIQQAQGNLKKAEEALAEAERLVRAYPEAPRAPGWVQAMRVRRWLVEGHLARAEQWVRERRLPMDLPVSFLDEAEYLALARVLLLGTEQEAGLALVERLMTAAERSGRIGSWIELLLLRALAYQRKDEMPHSLASLERAFSLAQPEGYLRIFLDEGKPMAQLLRHAGSHGIAPQYVSRLLNEFDKEPGAVHARKQPLIEPLSERELRVLQLVGAGLSNAEIASQLVVTLGTVKTHTSNIYRKLDVGSRVQAIARAKALGLL